MLRHFLIFILAITKWEKIITGICLKRVIVLNGEEPGETIQYRHVKVKHQKFWQLSNNLRSTWKVF